MKPARLSPPAPPAPPAASTYAIAGSRCGSATGVASTAASTTSTPVAASFASPLPALHVHYNGAQVPGGMFSIWELRVAGDPTECTIASVMADTLQHEEWLRLFQHAPSLLDHCRTSHSDCQHWRQQLGLAVEELSCVPGVEDVIADIIERISTIQTEMLRAAAALDATVRLVEGPLEGVVPPLPPLPTEPSAPALTTA